jgi:hypothetical protein
MTDDRNVERLTALLRELGLVHIPIHPRPGGQQVGMRIWGEVDLAHALDDRGVRVVEPTNEEMKL